MLKLRVLSGDMKGLEFPLDAPEVVIGRRKDSRICLPLDLRISRVHARIYHQDDALLLEDMGSANGTFMGRRRIYSPSVLHAGDQFRVGRTWLELVEEAHNGAAQEVAEQVQIVDSDSEAAIDAAEVTRDRDVVFAVSAIDPAVHRVPDDAEAQQRLAVAHVAVVQLELRAGHGGHALQRRPPAVAEVVHRHHPVPLLQQGQAKMAADVSGSAGH